MESFIGQPVIVMLIFDILILRQFWIDDMLYLRFFCYDLMYCIIFYDTLELNCYKLNRVVHMH